MRMFLIDVLNPKNTKEVDIEPKLENYYKLLNCNTIDITERKVGNEYYDFICDDEGLFVESPVPSVFDKDKCPMLVGNILICRHNGEGDEVELSKADIENIVQNLRCVFNGENTWIALTNAEY